MAASRSAVKRLLTELRADDVVVVTRLDRLARSTSELLRIAETIGEKHAGIQSLAEPWADTTTPAGRMVLTVFAGIAEFERALIATRTEEGRRDTQARGVPFGRPPKLRPDQRTLARHLIRNIRVSDAKALALLGIKKFSDSVKATTQGPLDGAAAFLSWVCLPATEEFGLALRDAFPHTSPNLFMRPAPMPQFGGVVIERV